VVLVLDDIVYAGYSPPIQFALQFMRLHNAREDYEISCLGMGIVGIIVWDVIKATDQLYKDLLQRRDAGYIREVKQLPVYIRRSE